MIIDAHVHCGDSFWGNFTPEFLLGIIGDNIGVCSNLAGIDSFKQKDEIQANLEMLEISKKYPQLKSLFVCQPFRTENADTLRKILKEYPQFIGLKFHPEFTKLVATSDKYDDYLSVADEYKLPCLYHSGHIKSRFSSPELIYEKAKQFPNVPVILGHLSTGPKHSHEAAIDIMLESIEAETATLYTDVSWIDIEDILLLIHKLKTTKRGDFTHRIMWATDAPVGEHHLKRELYIEGLNAFKSAIISEFKDEKLLEDLLCNNAKALFKL